MRPIDDHGRASGATTRPDETGASNWRALIAAVRYYRRLGIRLRRTKACRSRTNGRAERLIQTALREGAHVCSYAHSDQRATHLPNWLHDYDRHRPHAGLNYRTPVSTLGLSVSNLPRDHG
ncbi:integrase core domain-containing protein [Algiphilus sp.]|uniref:integrase core domain-containing protein n=1 Tax=Algiphilus sp. TaxID=1872431 RepID=UPI0025BD1E51|nr:integrase core domain-containing protein [Algiphilus sp.]MCK5772062.1 integrase core domain-containing protein [Algiphilus sp.]